MDCAVGHLTLGGLIDHDSHRVTDTQCVATRQALGIPTPANRVLWALVKLVEAKAAR